MTVEVIVQGPLYVDSWLAGGAPVLSGPGHPVFGEGVVGAGVGVWVGDGVGVYVGLGDGVGADVGVGVEVDLVGEGAMVGVP